MYAFWLASSSCIWVVATLRVEYNWEGDEGGWLLVLKVKEMEAKGESGLQRGQIWDWWYEEEEEEEGDGKLRDRKRGGNEMTRCEVNSCFFVCVCEGEVYER